MKSKGELYDIITELEGENENLIEEILQWRAWYLDSYTPQICYLQEELKYLVHPEGLISEDDEPSPSEEDLKRERRKFKAAQRSRLGQQTNLARQVLLPLAPPLPMVIYYKIIIIL